MKLRALEVRPLQKKDTKHAAIIDKKWFGSYGISEEELNRYIETSQSNTLALFRGDTLEGFATFEVLEGNSPKDYRGSISYVGKVLFIQQFTTMTNYKIDDPSMDKELLKALEKKAKDLGCKEVWEALSKDHPYSNMQNANFDAFGFYLSQGYDLDEATHLIWQPSEEVSISCFLFRKRII